MKIMFPSLINGQPVGFLVRCNVMRSTVIMEASVLGLSEFEPEKSKINSRFCVMNFT